MRALGLDIGDRYIGVSISDPLGILARPLAILERGQPDLDYVAIDCLVKKYSIERVVVGLPRLWDGTLGVQAEKVELFAERILERSDVPIVYQDERFSTAAARDIIKSRKRQGASQRDDAVAAAIILQDYLDEHRR